MGAMRILAIAALLVAGAGLLLPAYRPLAFVVLGALAIIAIVMLSGRGRAAREAAVAMQAAREKVEALGRSHLETLARRRLVLARRDHYGVVDEAAWAKEMRHFVEKVVRPALRPDELAALTASGDAGAVVRDLIEERILARANVIEADLAFSDGMTSQQFEQWCAKRLQELGWKTSATGNSGDQGADVIAEKDGRHIILQCKLYSNPVGNKAVQEAFAAQRHYAATASGVVTNADFTRSARALASTTGVLLMHHGDLERLDELLAGIRPRERPTRAIRITPASDG